MKKKGRCLYCVVCMRCIENKKPGVWEIYLCSRVDGCFGKRLNEDFESLLNFYFVEFGNRKPEAA